MKIFVNSAISFLYKLIFNFLIFIKAIFNTRFNYYTLQKKTGDKSPVLFNLQ